MDLNYRTNIIFPVPVHQFDVNGFSEIQDELIDYVYKMREKDPVGNTISNRSGWQSSPFEIVNEDDVLHSFLINCLSDFPSLKKSIDMFVYGWINVNKPGDYNIKHTHPTSDLSGVLWVKAPENCGNIVFDSPFAFQTHNEVESYTDEFRNLNNYNHCHYFNPIEGRILVFPSHLQHHVLHNKSEEDRISVSFNIKLRK